MPTEGYEDVGSPVLVQKKRMLDVSTIPLRHHSKTVKKTLPYLPSTPAVFRYVAGYIPWAGWVLCEHSGGIFRPIMHELEYDAIILERVFSALTTLHLDNMLSYNTERDTVIVNC